MLYTLKDRTGEIKYNSYGSKMTIIKYVNAHDIVVEFENGYITHTGYNNFKIGQVRNPYDKSVHNVGYIGEGEYKVSINKKATKVYNVWMTMIRYCYSKKLHDIDATGKDCSVCNEWHNFQNFAKWFHENYYEIEGEKMNIDKDILHKGNKIYSPDNCVFVPESINRIFTKRQNYRGQYPIGVKKEDLKYRVDINFYDFNSKKTSKKYVGRYRTIEEAFDVYKKEKQKSIKEFANYYKNSIPQKIYNAMINYKVEITD